MPEIGRHSAQGCHLGDQCSLLIAHVRAANLYDQACRMARTSSLPIIRLALISVSWHYSLPGGITHRSDSLAALALESTIISFLSSVSGLEPGVHRGDESFILSTRTLAYAAMLQLQHDHDLGQSVSSQQALMAAMDAAALLVTNDRPLQEVRFVDPILSVGTKSPQFGLFLTSRLDPLGRCSASSRRQASRQLVCRSCVDLIVQLQGEGVNNVKEAALLMKLYAECNE